MTEPNITPPAATPAAAGLARRLGAMVYDAMLILALWILEGFLIVPLIADAYARRLALQGALALTTYGFFAFYWTRHRRTLGMQAWRLEVRNADGSTISLPQATVRMCIAIPALALFGAGYWSLWLRRDRRSWSDLASDSQVYFVDAPAGS